MISVIAFYADDLIIACGSLVEVNSIIAILKKSFSIKELYNVQYCMGVKIKRERTKKQIFESECVYRTIGGEVWTERM